MVFIFILSQYLFRYSSYVFFQRKKWGRLVVLLSAICRQAPVIIVKNLRALISTLPKAMSLPPKMEPEHI